MRILDTSHGAASARCAIERPDLEQPVVSARHSVVGRGARLCMLASISALICTAPVTTRAGPIYKIVDSAGTVMYSDRPAAGAALPAKSRAASTVTVIRGGQAAAASVFVAAPTPTPAPPAATNNPAPPA